LDGGIVVLREDIKNYDGEKKANFDYLRAKFGKKNILYLIFT